MRLFTEEEKSVLRMFFERDAVRTAERMYESMSVMEEGPEKDLLKSTLEKSLTAKREELERIISEAPMIPFEEDEEEP